MAKRAAKMEALVQGELPLAKPKGQRGHGGKRAGAGRKRSGPRSRVTHVTRPATAFRFPVHVTTRMRGDVARLRNFALCPVLRQAFVRGCRKEAFRICQFSIQGNHIHLICEAKDARCLAAGVQAWAVRVARRLNRALGRSGSVFDDRYHSEVIKSPRQMRATLCYVMQNARRHGERIDPRWNGVDPFSSAWWFDGWRDDRWRQGLPAPAERTVEPAGSWLLTVGWRRHGLLAVDEVPAARRRAEARAVKQAAIR
jgi:REP element-mobilizing transposase RayT